MHESLRLYDAALGLIAKESEALDIEDEEQLDDLCRARVVLMEEAWRKRNGCDPVLLMQKLESIRQAQQTVMRKARIASNTLRLALQSSRKESGRLSGYGKLVNAGQRALIISKEG